MTLAFRLVNFSIKGLTRIACQVDDAQLDLIPQKGPLILTVNHINSIEVPLIFTHMQPRPTTGFAKIETWDALWSRWLFNFWGAIPIRRGVVDMQAFRRAQQALTAGQIVVVAPEGTRSKTGKLQKGYPGIVLLAARSGAPIQPMVYYGGESIWHNLRRFKRTGFHIVVGNPFSLKLGVSLGKEVREQITTEIMYQMAALLPPAYRGIYSDFGKASQEYLVFQPGIKSNLDRVRFSSRGSAAKEGNPQLASSSPGN
jgi:1-acyl-sn-glycerol-3-phosphate acyltransferase